MFCVIQEIENKAAPLPVTSREIKVEPVTWTMNGITRTWYSYSYSEDKFERPIRKAYKISIHQSYREKGKVKKRQWSICTMDYYSLLNSWPGDCLTKSALDEKLKAMGITENDLWEMVYSKLDPIIDKSKEEFQQTEEYRAMQEQKKILKEYRKAKEEFEEKYGADTYKYCYDVFGVLRNEAYFNELKANYKARKKYKSSYQNSDYSNYDWSKFSSYYGIEQSNYSEEEKELAKQIIKIGYKHLAKKLHPDAGGTKEGFQLLGNLKDKLFKYIK